MDALAGLNLDVIGLWVAFVLTLMVFSYLLGDNPVYRVAEHLFVGTAAGYAVIVAYHSILRPRLIRPLVEESTVYWYLLIPLALGVFLLGKGRRSSGWLGNTTMGLLFGIGAALAIGGALVGSLAPQIGATWLSVNPAHYPEEGWVGVVSALLIILGTTGTFVHFYYSEPAGGRVGRVWAGFRQGWGKIGYWFILAALGAIFGNTIIARLSLLVERIRFLLDTLGLLGS